MTQSSVPTNLSHGDLEMLKIHAHNGAQAMSDRRTTVLSSMDYAHMRREAIAGAGGYRIMTESGSGRERQLTSTSEG